MVALKVLVALIEDFFLIKYVEDDEEEEEEEEEDEDEDEEESGVGTAAATAPSADVVIMADARRCTTLSLSSEGKE